VRPLAAVLLGALDEAAMVIAGSSDPAAARDDVLAVVHDLLDGLLSSRAGE
jgi:hypothetical protein